jgi:ribosome-binding protein aMBF1 (putative translation factor)
MEQNSDSDNQNPWVTVKKKIKVRKPKPAVPVEGESIDIGQLGVKNIPQTVAPVVNKKKVDETEIVLPKYFPFDTCAKIIQARNQFGWTRKELGLKVNISEIQITNIENGVELYDPKLYVKLKKILDIK